MNSSKIENSSTGTLYPALSEREEIVSTLMYLIKLVKSTVLNVLTYLKVEQYTTKEMKCKGDYAPCPLLEIYRCLAIQNVWRKTPYNLYGRGTKEGLRHTKYMGEIAAAAPPPRHRHGTVGASLAAWSPAGSAQSRLPGGEVRRSGQRPTARDLVPHTGVWCILYGGGLLWYLPHVNCMGFSAICFVWQTFVNFQKWTGGGKSTLIMLLYP